MQYSRFGFSRNKEYFMIKVIIKSSQENFHDESRFMCIIFKIYRSSTRFAQLEIIRTGYLKYLPMLMFHHFYSM